MLKTFIDLVIDMRKALIDELVSCFDWSQEPLLSFRAFRELDELILDQRVSILLVVFS